MANQFAYFNGVLGQRALALDPEEALRGDITVSMETQEDLVSDDFFSFIRANPAVFFKYLKFLTPDEQELLMIYYLLGKTQAHLGNILRSTQTICSSRLRWTIKRLCAFAAGEPGEERLAQAFQRAGVENAIQLSKAVTLYSKCRSFEYVASALKVQRSPLRRELREAANKMMESSDPEIGSIGAYLYGLVDRASTKGQGWDEKQLRKYADIYSLDSPILGAFRVDISDPNIEQLFMPRANN